MSDFVPTGDLTLPAEKTNRRARPEAIPATEWFDATDFNLIRQALLDIQAFLRTRFVGRYLAEGGEESISVTFSSERGHANYNVHCTIGQPAATEDDIIATPVTDSFAVDGFTIRFGAALPANTVVMFTVEDRT